MKVFKVCLLLGLLLTIIVSLLFAQQNQSLQKPNSEIEALRKRISELESKLQTVENVEKMELAVKLADANARLANAEFGRFERELRDSNDKWLKDWAIFFLAILAVIGVAFWFVLKSLIANGIEKRLDGFKEAVEQVNILQDQVRILEKEHAASVLESSVHFPDTEGQLYSETVKALPDGGLLDLIADKTRGLDFRYKAAEVLASRRNPKLVSPVLELLNSVIDSEVNLEDGYDSTWRLGNLVNFLGRIYTQETHEGLTKFLSRLLTEDTEHKDLFLTWTVFSLAYVSNELNNGGSVSMLKTATPHLRIDQREEQALKNLARFFDKFDEPAGIKEILTNSAISEAPDVEERCLELLQKHDSEFVEQWKAEKAAANTETEESS